MLQELPEEIQEYMNQLPPFLSAVICLRGTHGEWLLHSAFFRGTDAMCMRDTLYVEGFEKGGILMFQRPTKEYGSPWRYRERWGQ